MIENLIAKNEGKTVEFKESAHSIAKIVQTVIAFANTAGGTIVIGVKDKTKEIVGVKNVLQDEERLANAISDSIEPLITPTIQLSSWRQKDLIIIHIAYSVGPYFLKSKGMENGTFVRFGSTNRIADKATIDTILHAKEHLFYDETPCVQAKTQDIDLELCKTLLAKTDKKFSMQTAKALDLITTYQNHDLPTTGGILLFGFPEKRLQIFPNTIVRCAKFRGKTKTTFSDQVDISQPMPLLVDTILEFIRKHTTVGFEIGRVRRKEVFQYPPIVLREAITNAIVHTDYSIKGSHIQVAIFDDRIEITNPGTLPFGLSLETALSGFSQLRNKVIGRVFRELNLIESWGTGLGRMIEGCRDSNLPEPRFDELDNYFKVTIFHSLNTVSPKEDWEKVLMEHLQSNPEISAKQAQELWSVSARTTSTRLKNMCKKRALAEVSTGPYDPHKIFVLSRSL